MGVKGEEETLEHLRGEGEGGHFDEGWGGGRGVCVGGVDFDFIVGGGGVVGVFGSLVEEFGKKYGEEYRCRGCKCYYWEGDAEGVEKFYPHLWNGGSFRERKCCRIKSAI